LAGGNWDDVATAIAIDTAGRIVVGGTSINPAGAPQASAATVARLTADGFPDSGFRFNATSSVGSRLVGNASSALGIALQSWGGDPDGAVVVAGSAGDPGSVDAMLLRIEVIGPSAGNSTFKTFDLGSSDDDAFVAVRSEGPYVYTTGTVTRTAGGTDLAAYRFLASLDPDASFGGGGRTVIDVGADDAAADLTVLRDGTVLVAGSTSRRGPVDFAVVKITADGRSDTSYGDHGAATAPFNGDASAAAVAVRNDGRVLVAGQLDTTPASVALAQFQGAVPPSGTISGYWLVASDGGIFAFGGARFYGSTGGMHLNQPIVGMAATPTISGYWLVASDGGIFAFGDARFYGSTGGMHLNQPIVGMAASPTAGGYWFVARDGGIFAFGDANFYGAPAGGPPSIAAMAASKSGQGYWLVGSDAFLPHFGDAKFYGTTGAKLSAPIVAMAATPSGRGYWLVASDGGIFNYGDATFLGSTGNIRLNQPIRGMAAA
jgi:uncharacterized delta-60 repeat protein